MFAPKGSAPPRVTPVKVYNADKAKYTPWKVQSMERRVGFAPSPTVRTAYLFSLCFPLNSGLLLIVVVVVVVDLCLSLPSYYRLCFVLRDSPSPNAKSNQLIVLLLVRHPRCSPAHRRARKTCTPRRSIGINEQSLLLPIRLLVLLPAFAARLDR